MVGVSHSLYWIHWLIIGTLMALVQSVVFVSSAVLLRFQLI